MISETVNVQESQPGGNTDLQNDSRKRPHESSLSDQKKQQLAEARQKKQQKALQREQELVQLKTKLNDFD